MPSQTKPKHVRQIEQALENAQANSQNLDEYLLTSEAAEIIRYSARQMIRMRQQGEGPAYIRLGGKILYRRADLHRWLDAHRVAPVREGVA